jgi:secreted trypsin-like serine protease
MKKQLVLFLASNLFVFNTLTAQDPKVAEGLNIVDGSNVTIEQYPFYAKVEGNGSCGGVILSRNWVLTAFHCKCAPYNKLTSYGTYIYAGYPSSAPADILQAQKIFVDKTYNYPNASNSNYDFTLLHLQTPIVFNSRTDSLIPFTGTEETADNPFAIDAQGEAIGYGYTSYKGTPPTNLKQATVKINSTDNLHIVVKGISGTPCSGDSGGPLIIKDKDGNNRLAGIASFASSTSGSLCQTSTGLTTYGKVSAIVPWIEQTTGLNYNAIITGLPKLTYPDASIFPNPTTGDLHIYTNDNILQIKINSIDGRTMLVQNENTNSLDISSFASGVYFISISTQNGIVNTRIVKN